ncbi:hypothetical protein Prum_037410 [Phytohabitans rumicis]|uniref:Type II secretion system protein GspF domain-containing protein n=1 Tax=Phytohabitans rumicis TaxID=1076125 RepID=A0A6V8L641_9ACTN|nr:hypothetical protein [Phytohabitans rumicis]GFJ90099.1 hypothetical protein Prum_037410 [Phytohabitans rumicis]
MPAWWLAAACLVVAAVVTCWPDRGRQQRLMGRTRPAAWGRRRPIEILDALSTPRAMMLSVAVLGLGGALLVGPVAGLVAGAYGRLAVRAVVRGRAAREAARQRARSLDVLCFLAADLRAGLPPVAAGPDGTGRLAVGADSMTASSARIEDRRMAELAAAAWRLAERTGAPIAELIERVEADARATDRAGAAAAAQAAGARATAWLLAGLPVGGIALGFGIGVDPVDVLLHTPVGAACAAGAIALQTAGLAWADRLTGTAPTNTRGPTHGG